MLEAVFAEMCEQPPEPQLDTALALQGQVPRDGLRYLLFLGCGGLGARLQVLLESLAHFIHQIKCSCRNEAARFEPWSLSVSFRLGDQFNNGLGFL